MRIHTHQSLLDNYIDDLQWIELQGVSIGVGRFDQYKKYLEKIIAIEGDKSKMNDIISHHKYIWMFHEISEFMGVCRKLKTGKVDNLNPFLERIQLAASGPINIKEETSSNNTPRNYMFEAEIASQFIMPEKDIGVVWEGDSDAGVEVNGRRYWIECKRLYSVNGLKRNVKRAITKLNKDLEARMGSSNRGLIAVDISRVINENLELHQFSDLRVLDSYMHSRVNEFNKKYYYEWQSIIDKSNPKIIGIVFKYSLPTITNNAYYSRCQWYIELRPGIKDIDSKSLNLLTHTLKQSNE